MHSDTGRVRAQNEDFCAIDLDSGVFVVCDGMGGAAAGEVASRVAGETMIASLRQGSLLPDRTAQERLADAVAAANRAVFTLAREEPAMRGMGTTLVALMLEERPYDPSTVGRSAQVATLAHVGDSRCYRLREGLLQQLTADHSLVAEQVRFCGMTKAEAAVSPMQHIITRSVGTCGCVEAEIAPAEIASGDLFLLCSDGLTREVDDRAIALILQQNRTDLLCAVRALVDEANARGGADNITCVLIQPAI